MTASYPDDFSPRPRSDPPDTRLTFGGEFADAAAEFQFQADRLRENRRFVIWVFGCALAANSLFYLNDWRFSGLEIFPLVLASRSVIVLASLIGVVAATKIRTFAGIERIQIIWTAAVTPPCMFLVSPPTDAAMFIIFMLPTIIYLCFPLSWRWGVTCAGGSSTMMLAAHLFANPGTVAWVAQVLGLATLNVSLALAVARSNRMRRQEWAATRSAHAANQELSEHREILRSLLKAVPSPLLIITARDAGLIKANAAARRYFGDAALTPRLAIETVLTRRDRIRLSADLRDRGHVSGFETRLRLPGGDRRDVLIEITSTELGGEKAILAVIVDISARKQMEARLERQAMTDPLTGLANRTRFFALAAEEIRRARRYGRPLAVLMADIDHFKRINDTQGHEAGDLALKAFANLSRQIVRGQDHVARLGGEEFGILLPETDRHHALALANRLRTATARMIPAPGMAPMTISIGVAQAWDDESSLDCALSRADQALYAAKRSGRNRALHFDWVGSPPPPAPPDPARSDIAQSG